MANSLGEHSVPLTWADICIVLAGILIYFITAIMLGTIVYQNRQLITDVVNSNASTHAETTPKPRCQYTIESQYVVRTWNYGQKEYHTDISAMASRVQAKVDEGWRPIGGVAASSVGSGSWIGDTVYQALSKDF